MRLRFALLQARAAAIISLFGLCQDPMTSEAKTLVPCPVTVASGSPCGSTVDQFGHLWSVAPKRLLTEGYSRFSYRLQSHPGYVSNAWISSRVHRFRRASLSSSITFLAITDALYVHYHRLELYTMGPYPAKRLSQ